MWLFVSSCVYEIPGFSFETVHFLGNAGAWDLLTRPVCTPISKK